MTDAIEVLAILRRAVERLPKSPAKDDVLRHVTQLERVIAAERHPADYDLIGESGLMKPSDGVAVPAGQTQIDWGEVDSELLNYLEGITRAATMERGQAREELELRNVNHIRALLRRVSGQ